MQRKNYLCFSPTRTASYRGQLIEDITKGTKSLCEGLRQLFAPHWSKESTSGGAASAAPALRGPIPWLTGCTCRPTASPLSTSAPTHPHPSGHGRSVCRHLVRVLRASCLGFGAGHCTFRVKLKPLPPCTVLAIKLPV